MSQAAASREINEDRMSDFLGKVVGDFGASLSSILSYIGIRLGLYAALADSEGLEPAELAAKTNTNERYVREWLLNQASGGYVHYDPVTGKYSMLPEQATALCDDSSPFYVGGGFYVVKAMLNAQPRITESFQNGGGMLWREHDPDLFVGTEKFFRPGYTAHLVNAWIPSLTGIDEKLKSGAKVADVGCGHGASTLIMAKAYPNSMFYGFDNHNESILTARQRAEDEGLTERVTFVTENAETVAENDFDLICFFDCLHDMGDPLGAMKRAFEMLADDGSVMIVEPMAGNTVEENFNPVGRTFAGASTLCCTANSMALDGAALGACASEDQFRNIAAEAGFTHFKRTAETPFNRIFEARK